MAFMGNMHKTQLCRSVKVAGHSIHEADPSHFKRDCDLNIIHNFPSLFFETCTKHDELGPSSRFGTSLGMHEYAHVSVLFWKKERNMFGGNHITNLICQKSDAIPTKLDTVA